MPVPSQITNNYGAIINLGGPALGITPADLHSAIIKAFPPKSVPELAKTALRFIQPAKREKGAGITGAGLSVEPEIQRMA